MNFSKLIFYSSILILLFYGSSYVQKSLNTISPSEGDSKKNKLESIVSGVLESEEAQKIIERIIASNKYHSNTETNLEHILFLQGMKIKDLEIGRGKEIICGQKVQIKYLDFTTESQKINDIELNLSNKEDVFRRFHYAIAGMREGGIREITTRASFDNQSTSNQEYKYKIEVVKGYPAFTKSDKPLRIFTNMVRNGYVTFCGDIVKINYKLTDIAGNILYDSKKNGKIVEVRIGDNDLPIALNETLEHMMVGSKRTAIIPPEYMKSLSGKESGFFNHIKYQKNQVVILDVEIVD